MLKSLFNQIALKMGEKQNRKGLLALSPEKVLEIFLESETLANIGTWILEIESGELFWSDQVYKIFELDPEKFPATYEGFLNAIHPLDREKVDKAYTHSLETGMPYEITHRLLVGHGDEKFVTERCKTYFDASGKAIRSVGTIQDVTMAVKLQNEVNMIRRMDSLGKMAGGIAHDYNNLLGIIVGYADIIKSKIAKDSEIYQELIQIEKAAAKSVEITRQLLTFSKENYAEVEVININERIISLDSLMRRLVQENIYIQYDLAPGFLRVAISKSEFDQIMINLISNAKDSMRDGGLITICTRFSGSKQFEMRVSDTGDGICEKDLPHVFEPFYTTKDKDSGTGLGLSTIYGIVKKYHGDIRLESKEGIGTTVSILFNSCSECEKFPTCKPCEEDKSLKIQQRMSKIHILLVEDDIQMRNLVESMIRSLGGSADCFTSPADALDHFSKHPEKYDLLITDVVMPGLNGEALKSKIHKIRKGFPVLFISGYTANVISDLGVDGDDINFLPKPFTMNELKNKLECF